jgi:thioesterase domain-containing protein
MTEVLLPFRTAGRRPALYCVHSASGSAYSYLPLAPLLPADQPLYGLEAPGFEDPDDQPLRTVAELSQCYLQAIHAERPAEPICLLGWSFGGVIAYDLALRLAAAGRPPRQLIVIDSPVPPAGPLPAERLIRRRFLADLTGAAPFGEQRALDRALAQRPVDEPAADTFAALIRAGVLAAEFEGDLLAQRYAVFAANVTALHGYQPTGRYHARMVAVWAAESIAGMPAAEADWSSWAPRVRSQWLPGDHYSIWQDGLPALAEVINQALQPEPAMR